MVNGHRHCVSTVLLVILGTVVGCDKPTPPPKEPPRVTVVHPEIRQLRDEEEFNGWLRPNKQVEVRARVRGHIKSIKFKDGDFVAKDQVLFEIDSAPLVAEQKQAEAAEKALKSQHIAAQKLVERNKPLVKTGAVSEQDYEKSVADADAILSQIDSKHEEANRRSLDVEYASIRAEISGKISKAELVEGDLVNAGGTDPVLTTIVATQPIYVDFNVDERVMQQYQEKNAPEEGAEKRPLRDRNIKFTFGLDTEIGFPNDGILIFSDNQFTSGTGTILVRGEAENPKGRLVPGSRVRVRVPVSEAYEAAVVPDTAVLSDLDRKYLLVLDKEAKVLRRDVSLGRLLDDGMRVILPPPGEEPSEDWNRRWESEWIVSIGLQKARLNYPVTPLDPEGNPIDTARAAK